MNPCFLIILFIFIMMPRFIFFHFLISTVLHFSLGQELQVDPNLKYVSDRIATYPIANIPEGKYTISCVEHGEMFGKTIDYQNKKDQVKKKLKTLITKGIYYALTAVFFALGFGWLAGLGWAMGAVLILGLGTSAGLAIIPIYIFLLKHRIILSSKEAEVWTLTYTPDNAPGAFSLGFGVNADNRMKGDILHAKLLGNYDHKSDTPEDQIPKDIIARLDQHPVAVASSNEYIVYLQFYQPNGLSQWLAAVPPQSIISSPVSQTSWKFTKVG